jgi:hypothetical protein
MRLYLAVKPSGTQRTAAVLKLTRREARVLARKGWKVMYA